MKVAVIDADGVDNLKIKDLPEPTPGPGQVLVRMRAASLNYRDLIVVDGGYGALQKHRDLVPLSDGAGEIAVVGEGVTEFKFGDRVAGCFFENWVAGRPTAERLANTLGGTRDGVACEYRVFPVSGVVPVPDHLSWIEAATLPCAALTAWSAVVGVTHTQVGDVLVTQGTGGVSLFALQFAVSAGAHVIATSSTDAKLQRLSELGATNIINYKTQPEWGQRVRELSVGVGADLVVEVGGAQTLKQAVRATRVGGTLALIGVLSGVRAEFNLGPIVTQQIRLLGISVGSRDSFLEMMHAIALHRIRPVVDRVFGLAGIREALAYLKSAQHFGKVCIEI